MHCNIIPSYHTLTTFPSKWNRVSLSPSTPFRLSFPTRAGIRVKTGACCMSTYSAGSQMSLYDLLEIPKTGSLAEIKQAYKQLARRYHPDVSPADRVKEYTQRFIRLNQAYQTLSDPTRRAVYDLHLSSTTLYHHHHHHHHHHHLSYSTHNIIVNASSSNNNNNKAAEENSIWASKWQRQVSSEMNKRSMNKSGRPSTSSGARMRRQNK